MFTSGTVKAIGVAVLMPALTPRFPCSALILALLLAAPAAAATLAVSDGECLWRVTFDPAVTDRARLEATLDYLAGPEPVADPGPPLNEPAEIATIDLPAYRGDCAARRAAAAGPRLLDLPGVLDLRNGELAALDDACALNAARLAAASGTLSALRGYAPAAACTRWVAALETPADTLRRAYDEHLGALCEGSTEPNRCMDYLQKEGEKAPRETRMRLALLREGWARCAAAHVTDDGGARRRGLRDALFRRFGARASSCAR